MRTTWTIIGLVIALGLGTLISFPEVVAQAPDQDAKEQTPAEAKKDKAAQAKERTAKIAETTRKIHIAELKLEQARMEGQSGIISAGAAVMSAQEEHAIAVNELTQFREFDMVQRTEQAQLSLLGSRDRAQEAAEELAQIQIMYEDQDLDDRTAEFVIQRGRRNAERAQARIALEEMALRALTQHELPRELRKRTLSVSQKQVALESSERAREAAQLKSQISLASAESELTGLRLEITKLRSEQ